MVTDVGGLGTGQNIYLTIVVMLTGAVAWYAVQPLVTPLRHVPGPLAARFTRLWELAVTFRGDFHTILVHLHHKHGSVVRLSPNSYSFSSLHDQKVIYNLKSEFTKTEYYTAAEAPGEPNIFSMMDKDVHAERKKSLAGLYSMTAMVGYELAVDRMNAICRRKLSEFAKQERLVSIPEFLQFYAFDVIGEITLGKSFGMMEAEADIEGLNKMTRHITLYQGLVGIISEWQSWIVRAMNLLRLEDPSQNLDRIAQEAISAHRLALSDDTRDDTNQASPTDPFVVKLLRLERAGKIDFATMLDSVESNIAAGSDTIAITLSAALYYLYHTPRALQALRHEIDTTAAAGRASNPITFEEAQRMPYLHAVINEALRLHPAVGYMLPRRVPKGGVTLNGIHFPEGTSVGVSAWTLHRDHTNYGPDASSFRPERFLSGSHANSPGNSFSFGAGSRTCLGKNIAIFEIAKVLPEIVRHFDLVFSEDEALTTFSTWFVWAKYRCYVRVGDKGR